MHIKQDLNIQGNKILIIGNRSYKNMGDELILLGTVKLLLQQKKLITISCYDPKRLKQFFSQFIDTSQITFIHEIPKGIRSTFQRLKKGGLKELKYFRETDTIILGGGEIITEENPNAYRYRLIGMWPFLVKQLFKKKKKYELIIMGGIQIPKTKMKLRLFKYLLNQSTYNYLRDFQAVEEIKKLGYSNTEFFMDTSYFSYDRNNIEKPKKQEKYIIINLNKNGEQFINEIAKDCEKYFNQGYKIYYVPIAKGHNTHYQDIKYKEILEEKIGNNNKFPKIFSLDREENFQRFTKILKGAELVISTRLHLFLIASFLGISTKVYPYQRKILKMQEVIKTISLK